MSSESVDPQIRETRWKKIIALGSLAAALAAVFLAFTHKLLQPASALNIYPDNEWFLGPVLSYASEALRHFILPLRMETILGGIPLYDAPQVSAFYPFYFAYLPIFQTPLESIKSLHWITLFHVAVFEINAYVLMRTLRVSRVAALVGVTVAVFSLTTIHAMKWVQVIATLAWLPLYLAGVIRVLENAEARKGRLILALGFVLMCSAMIGQTLVFAAYLTLVIAIGYFRWRWVGKASLRQSFPTMAQFSLILGSAVLLASPMWLPIVADMGGMIRWIAGDNAVIGHSPIPFSLFLTDQIALREVPSFLFGGEVRHAIADPYIGVFPILLACLAIMERKRHWIVIPIALVAVYSFLSSFGSHLGLAYINYHLPLLNKIREPSYYLLVLNVAVGILAAIGIDFLLHTDLSQLWGRIRSSKNIFLIFAMSTFLCAVFAIRNAPSHNMTMGLQILSLFFIAILLYFWRANCSRRVGVIWKGMVVTAIFAIQILNVKWISPTISDSVYLSGNYITLEKALSEVSKLDPQRKYRVIFGGNINKQGAAMFASYNGIRTLNSYVNPLPYNQFSQLYYFRPRTDNYARALGAKYLICRQCSDKEIGGYRFAESIAGFSIYTTDDVLPRLYITNKLKGRYTNLSDYVAKMSKLKLSQRPLLVDNATVDNFKALDSRIPLICTLKTDHKDLNDQMYAVSCNTAAAFVLNEFYTKSWKAWVDGNPVRTFRVNGNQIAIVIPSGAHAVEFKYSPAIVNISYFVFLLGLFGLVLLIAPAHWVQKVSVIDSGIQLELSRK